METQKENEVIGKSTSPDYGASIVVALIVSFIGWLTIIGGIGMSVYLVIKGGNMAMMGIGPSLGAIFAGLLLVITGQTSRAILDNTNYSKEIVELLRKK